MGSCIICGTSTDGRVCSVHQEDVAFQFEGETPDQLTADRYYQGTVDGFAEFGVFVDIGDAVTGLLHRSELEQRLDSLDWDPGDQVFVQVTNVRDNGNIDLGWSIRQNPDDFRGVLVDGPGGAREPNADDDIMSGSEDGGSAQEPADSSTTEQSDIKETSETEPAPEAAEVGSPTPNGGQSHDAGSVRSRRSESSPSAGTAGREETDSSDDSDDSEEVVGLDRVPIETLPDRVGDVVRIEGEVTGVRQTSGPTLFELRDESGTIECAAFDGAGVRAFPEVDVGEYVRLDGEVEQRRGDLQVETDTLLLLQGEERETVSDRIETAVTEAVRPDRIELLGAHDPLEDLAEGIGEAATIVRRAIKDARPIVVRHAATADGYAAGAAIERAVLPRLREEHARSDAEYHYFDRRPTDGVTYDLDAVTDDVTTMLENRDRHGEQFPLVVLVGFGATLDSADAYDLLDIYGVDRLVIDDGQPDDGIQTRVDGLVAPGAPVTDVSTAALAANVAAHVNESIRSELDHVPAVGYWTAPPQVYADLAAANGYDADDVTKLRDALALEAHYQSYNDKRELIADLLFEPVGELADHISEQFREKLETELDTASENVTRRETDDLSVVVLDADAFTHRFDFPPTQLLVDALHRRESTTVDGRLVTLAAGSDKLYVNSTEPLDLRTGAAKASETVAGLGAVGGASGYLEFPAGEREETIDAVIDALVETIAG
jgi:RecJ-like exonuclease